VLTIHEFGEGRSVLKRHNNFSQNQLRADWRCAVDGCQDLGCMIIGPIVKDCGCYITICASRDTLEKVTTDTLYPPFQVIVILNCSLFKN